MSTACQVVRQSPDHGCYVFRGNSRKHTQLISDRNSSELWRCSTSSCRSNTGYFVIKEAVQNIRINISWRIATTAQL